MKEEIEDILMNSYDKFGNFDQPKATKELLNLFGVSVSDFVNKKHEEANVKYEENEMVSDYESQYWWGRLIAFGELKKYIKNH